MFRIQNVSLASLHMVVIISKMFHPFQPQVIEDLVTNPCRVIESSLEDLPIAAHSRLERKAAQIGETFRNVFLKFADVHHAINHANKLNQDDIDRTGNKTKKHL